jgi:hypothetical protein
MKTTTLVAGFFMAMATILAPGHASTPGTWPGFGSAVPSQPDVPGAETWDASAAAAPRQDAGTPPTVIRHTDTTSTLADRWAWATTGAGKRDDGNGCWVGYSIVRRMGERSFIGSYYSDRRLNRPSLGELVTGMSVERPPDVPRDDFGSMEGVMSFDEGNSPQRMVDKEVGLLFHVGARKGGEIDDLKVSNLSLHVDLGGDPLVWLGGAGYEESVTFLEGAFKRTESPEAKKEFMMAIGLHNESKRALEILKEVLLSSAGSDLREDAAFWIGQTNTDEARKILTETAWNDRSEDVREKCIFSVSQMEGDAGVDALIALAKGHRDGETRKHAAFWLGQKATEKAVGALKDVAFNDEDTEVQRNAMFALTQVDNGGGVDELIKIARTHPNPKIRKDAIFWLGQSEDPKALDVLVEIVKGK